METTSAMSPALTNALAASAPAAAQFASVRTDQKPSLTMVPSSQEVEWKLGYPANGPETHAATREEILSVMQELRDKVSIVAPGARMAEKIVVYVQDNATPNLECPTIESDDKKNAVMGIGVTTGALDEMKANSAVVDEHVALKDHLAHEFAHHLFAMNPQLLKDPRFLPTSDAYKQEFAGFNLHKRQAEEDHIDTNRKFYERTGETWTKEGETAMLENFRAKQKQKMDIYKQEAQADKLGIWLSHSDTRVTSEQLLEGSSIKPSSVVKADLAYDFGTDHPSFDVRKAEMKASLEDIQHAGHMPDPHHDPIPKPHSHPAQTSKNRAPLKRN